MPRLSKTANPMARSSSLAIDSGSISAARISFTLPVPVAERVGGQPHRQLGVRRRRSQHAPHDDVARPVVGRAHGVLHLTPRPYLDTLAPHRHANLVHLAVAVPLGRLDAQHVMTTKSRSCSRSKMYCGFATTRNSDPRERAANVSSPASRRSRSCDHGLGDARFRRGADRGREHQHVDVHPRLGRKRRQRGRLRLRSFDHQPLRQDDHRLGALDIAKAAQERGKSRHRLRRQLTEVVRQRQGFLLDVAIAGRHRVRIGVAAGPEQQPLRDDRVRPVLEGDRLVVADVEARHHPVVRAGRRARWPRGSAALLVVKSTFGPGGGIVTSDKRSSRANAVDELLQRRRWRRAACAYRCCCDR